MTSDDPRDRREEVASGGDAEPSAPRRLDAHLAEYARDSSLWPVLFAAIAIFVTLGSALMLAALRLGNLFALAALAVLAVLSLEAVWRDLRRRRLGPASRLVLGWWLLSAATSALAIALGWI